MAQAYCRHPDCVLDISREARESSYLFSGVEPLAMLFDTDEELIAHIDAVHPEMVDQVDAILGGH